MSYIFLILAFSFTTLAEIGVKHLELDQTDTCIIYQNDKMKCWGPGNTGNLPTGNTNSLSEATEFSVFPKIAEISLGISFGCARNTEGQVKCWGYVPWIPYKHGPFKPMDVEFKGKVKKLASARNEVCALLENGSIWCKGLKKDAHEIALSGGAKDLDGEEEHFCALGNNGDIWCWGKLADDNKKTYPEDIHLIEGINSGIAVDATTFGGCAIEANGGVKCWGANDRGQLGRGEPVGKPKPGFDFTAKHVSELESGVKSISAVNDLHCAIKKDGSVSCWGQNWLGAAGVPLPPEADPLFTHAYVTKPNKISGIENAERLYLGVGIGCVYLSDGKVKCWGSGFKHMGNGDIIHSSPYEFKAP